MAEYIKREEAIKRIQKTYCADCSSYNGVKCRACGTGDAIDMIEDAPAADVAPVVHGRWEVCDYVEPDGHGCGTTRYENAGLRCTHCVHVFKRGSFWRINYCPNCGAKLDLEGEK